MTTHERKQAIEHWLSCKDNTGYFDKDIARITGNIKAAQVYSTIRFVFRYTIWMKHADEVVSNDGWFYLLRKYVCDICEILPNNLSRYTNILVEYGLLERMTKPRGRGKGKLTYYRFPERIITTPNLGDVNFTRINLMRDTHINLMRVNPDTHINLMRENFETEHHGTVGTPGFEGSSTRAGARAPTIQVLKKYNIYGCGDAYIGDSGPSAPHPNRIPASENMEKNSNTNTSGCADACIGDSEPSAPHPNRVSASVRVGLERNHTSTKTSNCSSTETSNYGVPNGSKDPLGRPCTSQESVKHGSSTLDFVDPAPRSEDSRGVSCNPSKLLEVPNYSKLDFLCAQLCFNRVCANFPKSNASKDGWENVKHDWSVTISKLAKKFTNGDDELVRNALTWAFGPRSRQNGFLQDNIRSLPMLLTKKWNAGGEKEFTFDRLLRDYSSETQPVREDSIDDKLRSECSKALAQYDDTDGVDEECVMSYVEYIQDEVDELNKLFPPEKRGNWHRTNKIAQIIPWLTDIIVCYHGDSTYPDVASYFRRFFQRTEFKIREGALHYLWPGYFSDDCNVYSEFENELRSSHPNLFN